jgi:hypothetical protein
MARPLADRRPAVVHPPWTAAWWSEGTGTAAERERSAALAAIFGAPPSLHSLAAAARERSADPPSGWTSLLHGARAREVPHDALVVLAGHQPVLLGGAALVAHKACTAIALARQLEAAWGRRVVPVFLLATEDHDTSEVDHVDFVDTATAAVRRVRVRLEPRHDRLLHCTMDERSYDAACTALTGGVISGASPSEEVLARSGMEWAEIFGALRFDPVFPEHVEHLMDVVFGPLGLLVVRAHEVTAEVPHVLAASLARKAELTACLAAGAEAVRRAGLPASFDAGDPRPLLLESSAGRRRRLEADDAGAAERLRAAPSTFSPHAALRPIVQAAALPVIGQICGPSELLYLGQARRLHALLGAPAPVLVPRLEATSVPRGLLAAAGGELAALQLPGPDPQGAPAARRDADSHDAPASRHGAGTHGAPAARHGAELARRQSALLDAARAFVAEVRALEPLKAAGAERWLRRVEHGAWRLAETPWWHGRLRQDARTALRPRGRAQDTVLAWIPDALHDGRPRAWAEHIVSLCRPLDPPGHVLHVPPGDVRDG